MKRLFRTYELVILYFIGIAYLIVIGLRSDGFNSSEIQYIFFEAAIIMLVLYLTRETILFFRIKKYHTKSIISRKIYINLVRLTITIGFYFVLWISDVELSKFMIVLIGPLLNIILPKPISESFFVTDSGYILKGIYYDFSDIDSIDLFDSGDVEIISNGRQERVAYYSKKQKKIIFEFLQEEKSKDSLHIEKNTIMNGEYSDLRLTFNKEKSLK